MKALFSQPTLMPHSNAAVQALYEAKQLLRFETSFHYNPDAWLSKWIKRGAGEIHQKLLRRNFGELPSNLIGTYPWWEVARVFAARVLRNDILADRLWEQSMLAFDRHVANSPWLAEADTVHGFEHSCAFTFDRAKRLGIHSVFHAVAAHFSFYEQLRLTELGNHKDLDTPYLRRVRALDPQRNLRKKLELDLADLIVANSQFTARTLHEAGYSADKIRVIPLGAPPVDHSTPDRREPLFFYAGNISLGKGAHYLLEAWRKLDPQHATLILAGGWHLPSHYLKNLPPSVKLLGPIPHASVFEWLKRVSVLVFPSLCDGFGMVLAEALAFGVPVITTSNVGSADLLSPGRDGWILPPANQDALSHALAWCLEHPAEIAEMRPHARATAGRNQWADYRKRLIQTLDDCFPVFAPKQVGAR